MLVFDYVFDAFVAVWGQLCSLLIYRSSCHWTHLWWLYPWNVVWLWGRLCHLSLVSWSWCVTWRLSFFMSVLLTNHVLHRFWVLVFWARISHFSFTVSDAAFSHSTLVVGTIFWLNKFPRFILFKRPIHRFYSWDIIFHTQCLLSGIWSFQYWSLIVIFWIKQFLAFSLLLLLLCSAWMNNFVVDSIYCKKYLMDGFWGLNLDSKLGWFCKFDLAASFSFIMVLFWALIR